MSRLFRLIRHALIGATLALAAALGPALAQNQNPFDTVIRVNDGIVTRFEIVQRERLMQVLRMPDVSREAAREALIDDRLKRDAAREAGIVATQEDIDFGVEDFAARANLTGDEFLAALGDVSIAPETVRDFIEVNIVWGEVLRERFTARARPSDAEIDRALALGPGSGGGARVLVSEIVLPLTPELARTSRERAAAIAQIDSFESFAAAARRFSVAPSGADGGRLDWRPLSDLPPEVASRFLALQPGDVTSPILLGDAIAVYQLRTLEDARPQPVGDVRLDFMVLQLTQEETPGAVLASWQARTDGCADLYSLYRGASEARLRRTDEVRARLPGGVAATLDRLDPGEAAALPGTPAAVAMLCARTVERDEDLSREDVARQLFGRRLESLGDSFLAQLRADAFIAEAE